MEIDAPHPLALTRRASPARLARPASPPRQPSTGAASPPERPCPYMPPELWQAVLAQCDLHNPSQCLALLATCQSFAWLLDPLLRAFYHDVVDPLHLRPCLALNKSGDAKHELRVALYHLMGDNIDQVNQYGALLRQATVPRVELMDLRGADFVQASRAAQPHNAATWCELLYPLHMARLNAELLWAHTPLGLFQRCYFNGAQPSPGTELQHLFYRGAADSKITSLRERPDLKRIEMPRNYLEQARKLAANMEDEVARETHTMALAHPSDERRRALAFSLLSPQLKLRKPHRDTPLHSCVWRGPEAAKTTVLPAGDPIKKKRKQEKKEAAEPTYQHVFLRGVPRTLYKHDGPQSRAEKCRAVALRLYLERGWGQLMRRFYARFRPVISIDCC